MDWWVGVTMVLCAVALLRWVQARSRYSGLNARQTEQFAARIAELERRLGDMQELLLAIDEKLEQLNVGPSGDRGR